MSSIRRHGCQLDAEKHFLDSENVSFSAIRAPLLKLYCNSMRQYKLQIYIRRTLEIPQLHILSLMLCRSHLELMEKTELGLISLKEQMHLHVCMFKNVFARDWSMAVSTCACVWLTCRWFVGDCLFPPLRCLSTADDGQLICGPEISVLEKEVSWRHDATNLNWSHLVRLLWQNMCVRLVMRTGQAFSQEGSHRPWDIRYEHTVTAAFWEHD